jgi:hypothetical protein
MVNKLLANYVFSAIYVRTRTIEAALIAGSAAVQR